MREYTNVTFHFNGQKMDFDFAELIYQEKPKMTKKAFKTGEFMEALTTAVEAKYRGDPTSAGLVTARLANGDYWVSIVRYNGKFGEGKYNVVGGRAPNIRAGLKMIAIEWLNQIVPPTDPVSKLRAMLYV